MLVEKKKKIEPSTYWHYLDYTFLGALCIWDVDNLYEETW